jgi:putative hydrolase of the HAD superfamily
MKYQAVIFDLFGTLIDSFSLPDYLAVVEETAGIVGTPGEAFLQGWRETFNDRMTGKLPSITANIEYVCRELGIQSSAEAIAAAAKLHSEIARRYLVPRKDSLATIAYLKAAGRKIGLISDCSAEVPPLWADSAFAPLVEVAVFSCRFGLKKPDPRIYLFACKQLGVKPEDCLYIGDGSSRELTGAQAVGMDPVQILVPYELSDTHRVDTEDWPGPVISSFQEIPALLE